jgi:hypothetical protein
MSCLALVASAAFHPTSASIFTLRYLRGIPV